jgi:hypothetical protein
MILIAWIIGSFVAGLIGTDKRIGFFGAFFLSLIISPLIGIVVAAMSKSDADVEREKKLLQSNKKQEQVLQKMAEQSVKDSNISVSNEILKLKELQNQGILTEEEFEAQKKKLLGL